MPNPIESTRRCRFVWTASPQISAYSAPASLALGLAHFIPPAPAFAAAAAAGGRNRSRPSPPCP